MQTTTARDMQNHFKAGLQIAGEDNEGNLEWMGEKINWQRLTQLEQAQLMDMSNEEIEILRDRMTENQINEMLFNKED